MLSEISEVNLEFFKFVMFSRDVLRIVFLGDVIYFKRLKLKDFLFCLQYVKNISNKNLRFDSNELIVQKHILAVSKVRNRKNIQISISCKTFK